MARGRVLAIGHDWRMRRLIQANLEAFELEVHGAVDGNCIPDPFTDDPPDLILLDIDSPGTEVVALVDRLRAQLSQRVPIIVISAEPPTRDARWDAQVFSYLLKPFAVPALLQEVGQALGGMPRERGPAHKAR